MSQAVGNEDICRSGPNPIYALKFIGQCFAQRRDAGEVAVMDMSRGYGGYRRRLDVPRRVVYGLTKFHMNQFALIGKPGSLGVHAPVLLRGRGNAIGDARHGWTSNRDNAVYR